MSSSPEMPTTAFLLQGVTQDNHLAEVRQLIQIPDPERIILCIAFMNEAGVVALEEALSPVADRTTVLAGIRNGITSAQGLSKCLEIGCTTYAVDVGSSGVLFHPKVYLSRNSKEAKLIVGSANLTVGGLNANIEASLVMELNLATAQHKAIVEAVEGEIDGMIPQFPSHVFQVADDAAIEELLVSGRVTEERERRGGETSGSSKNRALDTVPKMPLFTWPLRRHRTQPFQRQTGDDAIVQDEELGDAVPPANERLTLVWQSNSLTRRDLNIPTAQGTNPTGSMLFGRGGWEGIDHRHYFRDTVFADLTWQLDSRPSVNHMERTQTRFQLVIRGVDYGVYTLALSHNTLTDTTSYAQRNSMTQLHWGGVRRLIAQEDLLDRILYLYRDDMDNGLFVLEID